MNAITNKIHDLQTANMYQLENDLKANNIVQNFFDFDIIIFQIALKLKYTFIYSIHQFFEANDTSLEKLSYMWLKTQNENEKSQALRAGFKAHEISLQSSYRRNSLCSTTNHNYV